MTSREIEVFLLKEIKEFIDKDFQVFLFRDMNKINGKLEIPRVMTRTIASRKIRSYESEENTENDIIAKQIDVVKHSILINFVGISQEVVSRVRSYFNHKRGFTWFVQKANINLVRDSVSEIRDITDNEARGMVESWQFEIDVRTTEETNVEIPIVKEVKFVVKDKSKED